MAEQLLDRILEEIRQRMDESRAAYHESQRLEAALAALGQGSAGGTASPARARRTRRRSTPTTRSRAPRGENLRRIREQVAQRPGASAGEIASATGIGRATVASTLGKLARDGELEKADLPSGRVGYRVATTATPPVEAVAESAPDLEEPTEAATNGTAAESEPARKPPRAAASRSRAKPASKRTSTRATAAAKRKTAARPASTTGQDAPAPAAAPDEGSGGDGPSEPDAA